MAWIELHQELPRHPKTVRLLAALKWSTTQRAAAVGHLCCLWCWAVDFAAADGDLDELQALEIAAGAEWAGDADAFAAALVKAGWLDQTQPANELTGDGARYRIHNWEKYIGRLMEQKEHNRERQALKRARDKARRSQELNALRASEDAEEYGVSHASVTRDIPRESHVTVTPLSHPSHPNLTVPNRTVPNLTKETTGPKAGPSGPGGEFQNAETATATTEIQNSKIKNQNEHGAAVAAESAGADGPGAAVRVAEGLDGTDVAGGGTGSEQAGGREKALGGSAGHVRNDTRAVAAVQKSAAVGNTAVPAVNQEPGTRNQKPAQLDREWDVFGYALRRGAFVDDKAARRLVAWGKSKNPHALREPFMFVVLGRLLDGCDKRESLETKDPVAYAIGWSQNADQAKRERPASARNMKRAVELLAAADVALSKNGTGHREWMDSLAGEIEAMAAGKKAQ